MNERIAEAAKIIEETLPAEPGGTWRPLDAARDLVDEGLLVTENERSPG